MQPLVAQWAPPGVRCNSNDGGTEGVAKRNVRWTFVRDNVPAWCAAKLHDASRAASSRVSALRQRVQDSGRLFRVVKRPTTCQLSCQKASVEAESRATRSCPSRRRGLRRDGAITCECRSESVSLTPEQPGPKWLHGFPLRCMFIARNPLITMHKPRRSDQTGRLDRQRED